MKTRNILIAASLVMAGTASSAHAALITNGGLTLNTDPTTFYQQTAASPCVIGGNNCINGAFPQTVAGSGGNGSVFNEFSPVYTLAQVTNVVGGTGFIVGLDYNQTVNAQDLRLFRATYFNVGGSTSQTFASPTILQTNNNGVGFSDFLLSGFVIPVGTTSIQFQATWFNNDGPDRFFLIGNNTPTCRPGDPGCPLDTPEPATMALLGLGLLGAGIARRRKQ